VALHEPWKFCLFFLCKGYFLPHTFGRLSKVCTKWMRALPFCEKQNSHKQEKRKKRKRMLFCFGICIIALSHWQLLFNDKCVLRIFNILDGPIQPQNLSWLPHLYLKLQRKTKAIIYYIFMYILAVLHYERFHTRHNYFHLVLGRNKRINK